MHIAAKGRRFQVAVDAARLTAPEQALDLSLTRVNVLADQAAKGSVAAFDDLVSLHASRVLNVACRLVGNQTDAEDVAQEAFVKAFRSLPHLRDRSQFTGWMLKIAVNAARDFLRRRGRRDEVALEEAIYEVSPDPTLAFVQQKETKARIRQLLATMPQKHQTVLILRDIEGLTYEEIAVALACTVSSVKNRLHRARAAFRLRAKPYISEVLS